MRTATKAAWERIGPPKNQRGMTTYRRTVGCFRLCVMLDHPTMGTCYSFLPLVEATRLPEGEDLEAAKRRALEAAIAAVDELKQELQA